LGKKKGHMNSKGSKFPANRKRVKKTTRVMGSMYLGDKKEIR